jgi:hypothetical protein
MSDQSPTRSSRSSRGIALLRDSRQWRARFAPYLGEILTAEGLGQCDELELSELTIRRLRQYGVTIVPECGPTQELLDVLGPYVDGGGQVIVFRPGGALLELAGLRSLSRVRRGAHLLLETGRGPYAGFPYEPLQIPGPVDLCQVDQATVVARVVSGTWPVEPYPAVTVRALGAGRIVAFCYDLARAVARLRQGDPELAESDTDSFSGTRPSDSIIDQMAPELGHVPQAEVHQALLARTVEWLASWPQPRLWYLPGEARSLLVLSGDGCARPPEEAYLSEAALVEQAGGHLTYYLTEDTALSPPAAAALRARGHELSIHPFAQPFSMPSMEATLASHLRSFGQQFGIRPRTVRHHCLQWLGWAEQAKLQHTFGLDMDLNFVTTRPVRNGYLFGAGRPLRFVDEAGALIDAWQQPTQFEDDIILGQHEISLRVDTAMAAGLYDALLDDAIHRWHSVIAVNLHPANYVRFSGEWGRHLVASTASKGVPIWNAERWLAFTADRARLRLLGPAPLDAAQDAKGRGLPGQRWHVGVDGATHARDIVLLLPLTFRDARLQEPADGPDYRIHGWRYRGLPLDSGALRATVRYA